MSTEPTGGGPLVRWYRNRIGDPTTGDEVDGYWLFAVGAVLGVVGIVVFVPTRSADPLRQWAIAVAAVGLALLLAGPVIRLPLRRSATWLVAAGLVVCALAIAWFVAAYPGGWSPETGQPAIIGLYALGAFLVVLAGVGVPLLAGRPMVEPGTGLEPGAEPAPGPGPEGGVAGVGAGAGAGAALGAAEAGPEAEGAMVPRAPTPSQSRFEVYEDRAGEWRWRLRHRNGRVLADSGQGYTRRHDAQRGLASVRRDAAGASVLLFAEPPEDEAFEPLAETPSRARFEVSGAAADGYRWRLVHDDGTVLAESDADYTSRSTARAAAARVGGYAALADYLRPDPTAFEVYADRAGEHRWRLVHRNGSVLADSGEGYATPSGARRAVDALRERGDDYEFEVYEDRAGEHRWRLRSPNGEVVADGGEGYARRDGVQRAVASLRDHAAAADVLDVGRAVFEVNDGDGPWQWRLRHRNGRVLARSVEGAAERSGLWREIERVKRNAPNAPVEDAG